MSSGVSSGEVPCQSKNKYSYTCSFAYKCIWAHTVDPIFHSNCILHTTHSSVYVPNLGAQKDDLKNHWLLLVSSPSQVLQKLESLLAVNFSPLLSSFLLSPLNIIETSYRVSKFGQTGKIDWN